MRDRIKTEKLNFGEAFALMRADEWVRRKNGHRTYCIDWDVYENGVREEWLCCFDAKSRSFEVDVNMSAEDLLADDWMVV